MNGVEPAYRYRAETLQVLDGDTYRLRIDLGFRCAVTIDARLRGVNCPELPTPAGVQAKAFAESLLSSGRIVVESYRDRQSFARWIVDVYVDGRSLAGELIAAGFAEPS